MILNVIYAEYKAGYSVLITFNNGESVLIDLENVIYSDTRKIFLPLINVDFFKSFKVKLNTITWDNDADFAPEFLLEIGKQQEQKEKVLV